MSTKFRTGGYKDESTKYWRSIIRKHVLDKHRFGPWALVAGASSGIGKELTRQLAANGLNVVIAARRIDLLKELGNGIEREFSVQFRAVQVDLSVEDSIDKIKDATSEGIAAIQANKSVCVPDA